MPETFPEGDCARLVDEAREQYWEEGMTDEQFVAGVLAVLDIEGRVLPPGGYRCEEYGHQSTPGQAIMSPCSSVGTHIRTKIVWPVQNEPNDNWPRYYGPWRPVPGKLGT